MARKLDLTQNKVLTVPAAKTALIYCECENLIKFKKALFPEGSTLTCGDCDKGHPVA
jgi:hypothetical protein